MPIISEYPIGDLHRRVALDMRIGCEEAVKDRSKLEYPRFPVGAAVFDNLGRELYLISTQTRLASPMAHLLERRLLLSKRVERFV